MTQEALEKDEIFVGWKEVKDLLKEGLSFDDFRERVKDPPTKLRTTVRRPPSRGSSGSFSKR